MQGQTTFPFPAVMRWINTKTCFKILLRGWKNKRFTGTLSYTRVWETHILIPSKQMTSTISTERNKWVQAEAANRRTRASSLCAVRIFWKLLKGLKNKLSGREGEYQPEQLHHTPFLSHCSFHCAACRLDWLQPLITKSRARWEQALATYLEHYNTTNINPNKKSKAL